MNVVPKKVIGEIMPYPKGKPFDEIQKEYNLDEIINLSTNESFVGISDQVTFAILSSLSDTRLYPDGSMTKVREAIAKYYYISADKVTLGAGSDGLIELISHAFLSAGDEAIMADITFPMYYLNAKVAGAVPVIVPLKDDTFDLDEIAKAVTDKTKVIWLCNPNNPTGTVYTEKKQREFLEKIPKNILVVIDEAYYEYATDPDYPDSLPLLSEYDNVIILRTFSKIYALASLRIGYAMSNPEIIDVIDRIRSPFNVCLYAQNAAIAALGDKEFYLKVKQDTVENLYYLYCELDKMKLSYLKSNTNFIMVNVDYDSREIAQKLMEKGIIVKAGYSLKMPTYLRVTVGTKEQCEKFITALKYILSKGDEVK